MTKHYQMLLKQAREERGWSQKDVAEKIGTDPKTVSRWERRVAYPSPYFRQKLGELFKKSLRELDLLNSSESELEDGGPPISKLPAGLLEGAEKPPDGCADEIGQQTGQPLAANALFGQLTRSAALHQQNRMRMLGRLRHAYGELLEYSLQEIAWIELGLAGMPDAVQNATNRLLRMSQQDVQELPSGTSILEVYEASERELLILGEPGAGKSTVMNALLQFLPANSALAYMAGKYETFDFTHLPDVDPASTYAVCNEVSDYQSTYMWGAAARRYLTLPAQGYHIITSVHADTIDDVLHLYQHDLRLRIEDLRRLGLIVNVGLIGQGKSQLRRWLTIHVLRTQPDPLHPEALTPLPLSRWNAATDTFEHASQSVLDELVDWTGLAPQDFNVALKRRTDCLQELAKGQGADLNMVQAAIDEIRRHEK